MIENGKEWKRKPKRERGKSPNGCSLAGIREWSKLTDEWHRIIALKCSWNIIRCYNSYLLVPIVIVYVCVSFCMSIPAAYIINCKSLGLLSICAKSTESLCFICLLAHQMEIWLFILAQAKTETRNWIAISNEPKQ